ncbi:MAG: hypothetical protein ABI238_05575 [Terrimesophilobacter sp.]
MTHTIDRSFGAKGRPRSTFARRGVDTVLTELCGWTVALVLALLVVAHIAETRGGLIFSDGDSMATVLIAKSIEHGEPQNWALSPVLFIPETIVYGALSIFGLGVRATLTLNAVVNLLGLYAAFRFVAGGRGKTMPAPVGALSSFAAFCTFAFLEGGPDREGFQLASMLTTTTYYSATIIGVVFTVGIVRRSLLGEPHATLRVPALSLAVVAAVSVLTNPLYLAWATIPVAVVIGAPAILSRIRRKQILVLAAALILGSGIGYLGRSFFATAIVADPAAYIRGSEWTSSLEFYRTLLVQTGGSVAGSAWLALLALVWLGAGVLGVRAWLRREPSSSFLGAMAFVGPIVVTLGMIAFGTVSDRYLQPWLIFPLLMFSAWPSPAFRVEQKHSRVLKKAVVVGLTISVLASAFVVPRVLSIATAVDHDLQCVVNWVNTSGRTGAGQFWTARAPKAYIRDPAHIVQIDAHFDFYAWLTNRSDRHGAEVTFLITGAGSEPYVFPPGFSVANASTMNCGRYTILDFGTMSLPLGATIY